MRISVELASILSLLAKFTGLPGGKLKAQRGKPRWERWMAIVDEHQLGPLIASRLLLASQHRQSTLPRWIEDALLDRYVRSGHECAFRSTEMIRLLDLFDRTEPPVFLKGAALAHTLYSEPAERPMSDFDILLPTMESVRATRAMLAKQGYRVQKSIDGPVVPIGHHHEAPVINTVSELTFELHTNLTTPPLPKSAILEMWRQRRRISLAGGAELMILDPVSSLLHHALHALADPIDSPLLRNLFEVAWLASKLDRSERSTVRSLAVRWRVEDRVGLALGLASTMFGSPPILGARRLDLRRRWCTARLEWTRSFAEDLTMRERLTRHLARQHFAAIRKGASPSNPLPVAGALLASVRNALRTRLDRKRRPALPRQIEPVSMPTALVAGCLLAHDRATGNVHLLDRASTRAYARLDEPKPTRELLAELRDLGLETQHSRALIGRLLEAGLVRRAL